MLDVFIAGWILVIFSIVYLLIPSWVFARRANAASLMGIAGNFARTALCVTLAVAVLARLKLLNAITMVCIFGAAAAMAWFRRRGWTVGNLGMNLQSSAISIIRRSELPPNRGDGDRSTRQSGARAAVWRSCAQGWLRGLQGREALVTAGAAALVIAGVLRCQHAFQELRFDQPEQYAALLHARGLLLNIHFGTPPSVFPALIATISLLSGADAIQVARFLAPLPGVLVVVAVGMMVWACTRSGIASVVTMYCLGAAVFLPIKLSFVPDSTWQNIKTGLLSSAALTRVSTEDELGLLFLLLAVAFLADWYRNWHRDSLVDMACCLTLAAIVSQMLLLIALIAAMALLLRPVLGLIALELVCYGSVAYVLWSKAADLPHEAGLVLPVAAAVAVGCGLALAEAVIRPAAGKHGETVLLAACLVAVVLWLPPRRVVDQFLEYEVAARKTQEIVNRFPRERWRIVAPIEQFSETFGFGSYEDLATFVAKYEEQVSSPEFSFPDAPEDLFIYVEKRPFQMFSREPAFVSFAVLTDATYRAYRSPAGRASLESAALQLCETYSQRHAGLEVYFENEYLRVYHLHQGNLDSPAPVAASSVYGWLQRVRMQPRGSESIPPAAEPISSAPAIGGKRQESFQLPTWKRADRSDGAGSAKAR